MGLANSVRQQCFQWPEMEFAVKLKIENHSSRNIIVLFNIVNKNQKEKTVSNHLWGMLITIEKSLWSFLNEINQAKYYSIHWKEDEQQFPFDWIDKKNNRMFVFENDQYFLMKTIYFSRLKPVY